MLIKYYNLTYLGIPLQHEIYNMIICLSARHHTILAYCDRVVYN